MKNPILTLIIGLIVGAGVGYLICKKTANYPFANYKHGFTEKNLTQEERAIAKELYDSSAFKLNAIADPVLNGDALQRINDFKTENHDSDYSLLTSDGKEIVGYFIKGTDLRTILKDPTVAGVSVYFAEDSKAGQSGYDHVYSLIFTGAKSNPNYNPNQPRSYANSMYSNPTATDPNANDSAFDFIQPCPIYCGNFDLTPETKTPAKK